MASCNAQLDKALNSGKSAFPAPVDKQCPDFLEASNSKSLDELQPMVDGMSYLVLINQLIHSLEKEEKTAILEIDDDDVDLSGKPADNDNLARPAHRA